MADLMAALRNADAAGDFEAAKRIAAMIKAEKQQQPAQQPAQQQQDPNALIPETLNFAGFDTGIPLPESVSAGLVGAGRGLSTIGRALGLTEPEEPIVTKNYKELEEARPISTTIGEVTGEAAPFLLPGGLVAKATTIPSRVAASGLLGATEAGLITKGKGGSGEDIIKSGGLGGTVAGTLELVLPVIGRLGGKIFRRLTGKTPNSPILTASGEPSQEFIEALDKAGLTLDDVANNSEQLLSTLNIDDAASVARKEFLERQGIKPTRAQITGDPNAFQAQSELVGQSGKVSNALKSQEKVLEGRFENAVSATGGSANPSTVPAIDYIADRAIDLDAQISAAYKATRELAPTEKIIKPKKMIESIRGIAGSDTLTGGLASGARDILRAKGLIGNKGLKLEGRIDATTAEEVRIALNGMYKSVTPFGKGKLEEMKHALDSDVQRAIGADIFTDARAAKAKFEKDLNRVKVNKFDARKSNLVRDILENKISPDTFLNDAVLKKSVRGIDLEQLKRYLHIDKTDEGVAAWNQVRADAMNHIKETAIKEVAGEPALSRAGMEKALKSMGQAKLKVLFSDDELKFLDDMLKTSKLREPVRGTQASPSGAAIRNLTNAVNKSSLLQGIWSGALEYIGRDVSGRTALRQPAIKTLAPTSAKISQLTPALIPAITSQEQQQ